MATAKGAKENGSPLPQLRELYSFMVEQKLETIEYDHQGTHVRLVRQRPQIVSVPMAVPVMMGAASAGGAAPQGTPSAAPKPAVPAGLTVKAPMMGIFYRASSPSSPPFAKRGDVIKRGQVLCLIEAMKVFNEIKADFDCVVEELLLENGKPVKAGQDMYLVTRK